MQETVEAIYEKGVFRPLKPLDWLAENRRVRVTVFAEDGAHPLADCFGILPAEDAREMMRIIAEEFEKV